MLKLYFFIILLILGTFAMAHTCPDPFALDKAEYEGYDYIFEVSLQKDYTPKQEKPRTNADYLAQGSQLNGFYAVKVEKVYKGSASFLNQIIYLHTISWLADALKKATGTKALVYAQFSDNDTVLIEDCGRIRPMNNNKLIVSSFGLLQAELDSLSSFQKLDKSTYQLNGKCTTFYLDGKVRYEGNLLGGKKEGEWCLYLQGKETTTFEATLYQFQPLRYEYERTNNYQQKLFNLQTKDVGRILITYQKGKPNAKHEVYNLNNELIMATTLDQFYQFTGELRYRKDAKSEWKTWKRLEK
ncbi:MAG: hypothetical protein ACKVTZ_19145 [Bacteroidia bacterium]